MSTLITTIGEILIDLTQTGTNENGIRQFAANPGGAPANVAVAAARLGAQTAFIGCVGADAYGDTLRSTLEADHVDISGLSITSDVPTTLAVVTVADNGERSFSFYRNPGADICLNWDNVPKELLDRSGILHFGSVSLTADPSCFATMEAVCYAKSKGVLISYDPNYRANLWENADKASMMMRAPLGQADIVKISDEETTIMTGLTSPEDAAAALIERGATLVLVTLGADGVFYRYEDHTGTVPGFSVKVADTNGAGDTFFGSVLRCIANRPEKLNNMTADELEQILRFANKAASLTTSRPGAIPAMPTLDEVMADL